MQQPSLQGEAEPNPKRASPRSVESGKVEKTQEVPKQEVEQFLKEEGDVDREETGDRLL